jgi:hypothetical protein
MNAGLEASLAAEGFDVSVEVHDRLAIIVPSPQWTRVPTPPERERILRLARTHGFTHVAIEIPVRAELPRRHA